MRLAARYHAQHAATGDQAEATAYFDERCQLSSARDPASRYKLEVILFRVRTTQVACYIDIEHGNR